MNAEPTKSQPDDPRAAARLAWARGVSERPVEALVRASVDAGFRSYWRGVDEGILMDSPPGLEDVAPWLHIRDLLEAGGVRVPGVLARDVEAGFLLLEDLGPSTCLQVAGHEGIDTTMDAAIGQLLKLQAVACPPDLAGYDHALLVRDLR